MTAKHNSCYYNPLPQGYIFRLLHVTIRPSNEPIQHYLVTSAVWDSVALKMGGVIVLSVHVNRTDYSVLVKCMWLSYGYKVTSFITTKLQVFCGSLFVVYLSYCIDGNCDEG